MSLTQTLKPGCLKVPLIAKDKNKAIEELIDQLDNEGLLPDKASALDAVITREKTRSTGIGSAIAIPHGKSDTIDELVMAVGVTQNPIEFGSIDNKPVTIIVLLISPEGQTAPHIQALAEISKLLIDNDFKTKLENAKTAKEAYELFCTREDS